MKNSGLWVLVCCAICLSQVNCTYTEEIRYTSSDASPSFETVEEGGTLMKGGSLSVPMVMGVTSPQTALNGISLNTGSANDAGSTDPDAQSNTVDAAQYTIQFAIVQSSASAAHNGPPNLRAIVYWLTAGKQNTREVSVGDGTSISGSAEGVTVILQDYTQPADAAEADYEVYVSYNPGTRPTTQVGPTLIPLLAGAATAPTVTENVTLSGGATEIVGGTYDLPGTGAVSYFVPPGVGVQSYFVTPGVTGGNVSLEVAELNQGTVIKIYNITAESGNVWVPKNPLTNKIVIANNETAACSGVSLTLGIDG